MWENTVAKQKLYEETLQQSTMFQRKNYKVKFSTIKLKKIKNK